MSILTQAPFPLDDPKGYQLWRVMAGMFPVPHDARNFAVQFSVDPLDLPEGLSPRQLWSFILQMAAIKGTTADMVKTALAANPRGPHAPFLKALVDDTPVAVSPEPMAGFDPAVSHDEALLFTDDLTIAVGMVGTLVQTLQRLVQLAPAVCLLRVKNARGEFFGTGFRVGPDLVLTNEHVLFPEKVKATGVHADFNFDVDAAGGSLPVVSLAGDVSTIQGDAADDWAVVRVTGMTPAMPVIDLAHSPTPKEGDGTFILQHPGQRQKRLGFVRNTISAVTAERVQYLTDTEPGSSGAPVFDAQGRVIALHHRGGTPTQLTGKAPLTKNQGVRIERVHAGLRALGLVS